MAGSARLASVNAGHSRRRVGAATATATPARLSLVALLATLCFPVFLSPSHALVCSCNDDSTLSNCRWEEWTCTKDSSSHLCFSGLKRLDDGSIRHDLGCVNIVWNPHFCGRVSETVANECCNEDHCNEDLTPTFLEPTMATEQFLSPTVSPPPTVQDGSGAPTLAPTPTPTVSQDTPQRILKCKCSQPLCDDSYCLTSYKCFKRVDYITDNQEEVSFGCYDTDRFNVCNGALDTSSQKIRCCDDEDMCNEDLNVVSHLQSSAEPNPVATPVVNTEAPPTPQPVLRCECSPSHCTNGGTMCQTNYSCFREVKYSEASNSFEHVLGCLDTIEQVKLGVIGVCNGKLDTETSIFKCCNDRDMCNSDLYVEEPPLPTTEGTKQPPSGPAGVESPHQEDDKGDDEQLFVVMSIVVILVMVVVTALFVGTVMVVFCMRFRREKTKVISVDQVSPPSLKQLSNSSITCSITSSSHYPHKDHTEINNYV